MSKAYENEPEIVEFLAVNGEKCTGISTKGAAESGLTDKGYTTAKENTPDNETWTHK